MSFLKQIFYSREEATCQFYALGLNQVCSSYLKRMHCTDLDFGGKKNKTTTGLRIALQGVPCLSLHSPMTVPCTR